MSNVAKDKDSNDQDPSNSKKEIVNSTSVSSNITSQVDTTSSVNNTTSVEINSRNEVSLESTNSNKSSDKGKPQKSGSCGSECQNQLNEKAKQKKTSDHVSNECEGTATVSGTRRSAAERASETRGPRTPLAFFPDG